MKKRLVFLLTFISFNTVFAQISENYFSNVRNEIYNILKNNEKVVRKIDNSTYKITISTFSENLVEYKFQYRKYNFFKKLYYIKDDFISHLSDQGKTATIYGGVGPKKVNPKSGDLYQIEYYFIDKNNGFKFEKRVELFLEDNILEKKKILDTMKYVKKNIDSLEYKLVYKIYESEILKNIQIKN